ncbi:transcriptional regulator with XRE-family HTH domain [Amycolatopsis lexingtonensis]|uniref:Transcriptional regulator with XRE-family HTH domain n=1 Tax=Amycolatopsis lexingtonensis TaxID=218822 RepID=A0ABR9HT36_9PSEU|nr:helix-turn-helix transcriptional regulator [Amycolatopsis lexingtonensis]MBE1494090.1 transcriptional regulator with XRE-family HTH domain [Amycolatopsis lexingtonensis]
MTASIYPPPNEPETDVTDQRSEVRPAADQLAAEIKRFRVEAKPSQAALARIIGYTRNYVSMAERVGQNLPSRELIEALERGLNTGGVLRRLWEEAKHEQVALRRRHRPPRVGQLRDDAVRAGMPALRRALLVCDVPDDGPVRPPHELWTAVAQATEQRVQARYAQLIAELPGLLLELGRARQLAADEREREDIAELLVLAYRAADGLAFKYGYVDLSAQIITAMRLVTTEIDRPFLDAAVAYVRTETFFASKDLEAAGRSLTRAIDRVPALKSTVEESVALGSLAMRAAVVAARAGKPDEAEDHLAGAYRAAEHVPEGVYLGTAFGPASVRIHEVAVAQELGDSPTAVQRGTGWHPPRELPAERRSHFYIDLAPAQLEVGRPEEAFASLQLAKRVAPLHTREHPRVKTVLKSLLRSQRTVRDELATFAAWADVN